VQTHQINVSKGRDRVNEIRAELFKFPEILDVFVTGRPDSLVVVCSGRPRPAEWLRALRAVGYEELARRRPSAAPSEVGSTDVAASSGSVRARAPIGGAARRAGAGHRTIAKKLLPARPAAAHRRPSRSGGGPPASGVPHYYAM
jgi:hypothetical protein